jgi:hypothetical protein
MERCKGGSNIYLYFKPDSNYPLTIWGKFALNSVTINQDLSLTLDAFYIEYLRYELAQYMCAEYNIGLQSEASNTLSEYRKIVRQISPPDLSVNKVSCFNGNSGLNFALINLSKGWTTPF